jgi:signal transduction histidine kinase
VLSLLGEWWASLRRLATGPKSLERLLLLTLGIALSFAIGVLALSAGGLLREQAAEQAMARVRVAGLAARDEIRRQGEDALTTARLLAGRPTLLRLVRTGNLAQLELFLRRYCETAGLDACGVVVDDVAVAGWGVPVAWPIVMDAVAEQGERFMIPAAESMEPMFGAAVEVAELRDARVVVLQVFDSGLAEGLAERVDMGLRFVPLTDWLDPVGVDFGDLHAESIAGGQTVVMRARERGLFVSSTPLMAVTGEGIALIEARLPESEVRGAVDRFIRRLSWLTALLVGLALAAALLLARRIGQPLRSLADSAERLGRGDFSAAIPVAGTQEVAALARTMDDMRRNLVDLTTTLRHREAEAQAVLQGIVEGVFAVDEDRIVRYLNPQAARLLGVEANDTVGRFCGDVLRPCVTGGQRPCETHCPIVAARGDGKAQATESLQVGELTRTVIVTSAAPIEGLQVQVMRDETELEAVRRARDSVLANISHEFRTPLAAQLASIELMLDGIDQLPRERLAELLRSLQRGSTRLTQLIDNLLESVRIESGQLSIRRQPVAVADVVEDARSLVEGLLMQRRQSLRVDLPANLPLVEGDAQRLAQVVTNLLANASKFGPEDSDIRVGGGAAGAEVSLWVEDHGPGVPDLEQGSVFERFYRAADAEPEPRGLGLGLWIVKSIVDRHAGRVSVERTAAGCTRFTITLPVGEVSS